MERLEKLVNILKLTPHRQPELVKEASHRILSRQLRSEPSISSLLGPILEILIQYCDDNDSAQRSLFNDYLNSVISTFQYQHFKLILKVLIDEVTTNGSARTITVALHRIPHLFRNIQPIELDYEPQKLLKALIEVARRSEDESVQRALDLTLKFVMPYLDYHVRTSKDTQFLTNSLIEILLRNLQNESSQTKRLAASSIANICHNSETQLQNTLVKLKTQLDSLLEFDDQVGTKLVGFCLCVKELPELADKYHEQIIQVLLKQVDRNSHDVVLMNSALEILKDLLHNYKTDTKVAQDGARLIVDRFLLTDVDGSKTVKSDTKVILQANALACISSITRQHPSVLDQNESIFLFTNHPDTAVRNQLLIIIGNYIEASWKFPRCVELSIDCEKIRKIWLELRAVLYDDDSHPDTLKSCIVAIKTCIGTLLESDHCLHIVEYQDFDRIIHLYLKTSFKPFKTEVLNLFSSLDYRTLHYLEKIHWSKMRAQTAGSLIDSLQDRIMNKVIITSLTDEHQRIRAAASSALIDIVPRLYVSNLNQGPRNIPSRCNDPIVSLADDISREHLIVLDQVDEHANNFTNDHEPIGSSESHAVSRIKTRHSFLSSSIIQSCDNPYNEQSRSSISNDSDRGRVNVTINLMYVVGLLELSMENNIERGKTAISSIVQTFYELSLVYPIDQYSTSWDCRPSEYCKCFTLLNFLLTYLENLNEPDVIIEDLEAYRNFLMLSHQLLYALCHESIHSDYESQRMKPYHKRQADYREGLWPDLNIKQPSLSDILQTFFAHLTKLLWLASFIIEEKTNPFAAPSKQNNLQQSKFPNQESLVAHNTLTSNRILFGRIHKKLESSYKSGKKNLNQRDEKFYQILETCLSSLSSLLEFIGMTKSIDHVRDILSYLRVTSTTCNVSSLVCTRQLLKSIFGMNILALYQVDPDDWFEEEPWSSSPSSLSHEENLAEPSNQGVYHYLVGNPYRIFSNYYSLNCSRITPTSDRALAGMNCETRRTLKVRRRIEKRVKSLFDYNPSQIIAPRVRQVSEILKNTITEFTPIVTDCMSQFNRKGFSLYQSETLHLMSYLVLLRVNYQKLPLARDFIDSIHKILDFCGEKMFSSRSIGIESLLRNSFTFLTLLTYERGPSKPMFFMPTVIQKLDDVRAKLSMSPMSEKDVSLYIVPLLRCLVEDLFVYRTKQFQSISPSQSAPASGGDSMELVEHSKKDVYEILEAERETVAQKLLDVMENPDIYDLLSMLILESRQNSSEIKYKKLSRHLLTIIPNLLSRRGVNLTDYKRIESTRKIIENISPEVFQPINFIFETLLEAPKPSINSDASHDPNEFKRWMSLVIIAVHVLNTQVKEEVFLTRLREIMSDEDFVEYLLYIAQLCIAEILIQLSQCLPSQESGVNFLVQQLSCYILYLTRMFQSGLFFQLFRSAEELIKREVERDTRGPRVFSELYVWARNPNNRFSLNACEEMYFHIRLVYPDLTIFWCNVMMLLNNVDCNRDFWRNLLVYECHQCQVCNMNKSMASLTLSPSTEDATIDLISIDNKEDTNFKRGTHINRPSSLNLSDISFSDQLRRSFIKRIAATESREKALNRNIIETSDEDGQLLEREVNIGNTEQCLAPNIELTRRGALCLVLDFVTISMNDVEHITWLIIHHVNDIIRWSHEAPIQEFISKVHGNSASSGIFIQAINNGFNNLTSISFVTRLIWTLEQVHYTQYGSLVVLLVEKLLSSEQLLPYRSLTRSIEEFACTTVQKLLNETDKNLISTNDERVNLLAAEDLDRVLSMLDFDLYPNLTKLLTELRESTKHQVDNPKIELDMANRDSDEDSDDDDIEIISKKSRLIYWLAEHSSTGSISSLLPALDKLKEHLGNPEVVAKLSLDNILVSFIITAIYSLALNVLPPPTRQIRPKFWQDEQDSSDQVSRFTFDINSSEVGKPLMLETKRPVMKSTGDKRPLLLTKNLSDHTQANVIEEVRSACIKGLFLLENLDYLGITQFEFLNSLIIRLSRLPMINSFVLTPPILWKQSIWPLKFDEDDYFKTEIPMVTHNILSRDNNILENFCDRLLKLGWISRRQFEEAWMTLLGVLSSSLSQPENSPEGSAAFGLQEGDKKANLVASCKVVTTITKLLLMTRRIVIGDPLSPDLYQVQGFDERVVDLTKSISSNLSALRKKTQPIFESLDLDRGMQPKSMSDTPPSPKSLASESVQNSDFSYYLRIPAQKLRMNSILNLEISMIDAIVIESEHGDSFKSEEVDVESCIRLLLSIYKQKIKDPNENLLTSTAPSSDLSIERTDNQQQQPASATNTLTRHIGGVKVAKHPNQLAPPLNTAICQSILALSDMFTEYDQFDWMFETFVQMFRVAERNEDEVQMQFLILGLCKATAVCCYEIPTELTTLATINHRDVMFEKCRQSIEKCVKSNFGPLRVNSLFGAFYLLEDSINIVASGAWELDHFKRLRQSRLAWILKLMPVVLDKENFKLLTKRQQILRLLEPMCEIVSESELKAIKI